MNSKLANKAPAFLITVILAIGVPTFAVAEEPFNSIGGYSIGQSCTSGDFSLSESEVRNPNEVLDTIKVERYVIKKKLKGGYDLRVECGIIDNKVNYLSLSARNSDDISVIKDSLREKMGRPADDTEESNSEPMNLLGNRIDGNKMESEYWFLSNERKATAFTIITVPYGASSLSELKWWGGIELSVNDRNVDEWNFLKQKGKMSSKQQDALRKEKKKDGVRGLLD